MYSLFMPGINLTVQVNQLTCVSADLMGHLMKKKHKSCQQWAKEHNFQNQVRTKLN